MTVTQLEQLTIYHLDDGEFENAEMKNNCFIQAETPYMAFVLNSRVKDEELLAALKEEEEQEDHREGKLLVYFSRRKTEEQADYIRLLELVSEPVVAFLFSKQQIYEAGAFNPMLSAETNFEFLCRVVRETRQCTVKAASGTMDAETEGDERISEEYTAQTLAYMIRYHMNHLHPLGMTDRIFSVYCEYAEAQGIFSSFRHTLDTLLTDEKQYEELARQTAPYIILRGDDTCGGVLQGFADDLAEGLQRNGQAVIMVDENFTRHDMLRSMVSKGVVGFQSKALEIDFFRNIHGPKFQFWFDNPLRFEKVLRNLPEEYYILCQDANYASLIREYYHTPNALQFPPGGRLPHRAFCGIDSAGDEERPYDVVFMGNYFQDDAHALKGFQKEFYDYMILHPCETFEQGLEKLLGQGKEAGRNIAEECMGKSAAGDAENFVRLSCLLKPACRMVIGHFRNAVIAAVLGAGVEVHVYGDSWRDYRGRGRKYLKIHPYAAVEESLQELARAKIGLNIMSWHKAGMTERIANIMLSGAVCLTEATSYLRENMREEEEIVSFCLDRLEELPAKVKRLLAHPKLRNKIAAKAYCRAMTEYSWPQRAGELIALSENRAGKTEKKRLVLFRGELDTINLFSRQLKQGFLELGYEIFEFDLGQSAVSMGRLYEYMQEGSITAMIAFNSTFYGMTLPSGENMWEVLGIPCINIFVDHPYWYHNILMRMPATGIVLCIDRNHMNYVNRFYPNISMNGFVAHGGFGPSSTYKPVSDRKTEVLYAGSLYADYAKKPDFSRWDFPAEQICRRSIEDLLACPENTIEDVIERQLHMAGITLPDEELRRFVSAGVYIERVVSSHYRERIVGSVAKAGILLELYGDGWSGCDWIGLPNVSYGGMVSPEEILLKMEDSKIVLNTLPWFKDGSHERVFNAMLCGAVAASETSGYLEETLPADSWVSFDLSEESLNSLPRRISGLLSDEERLQKIASAGHRLAAASHTWKARAGELHEALLSGL